MLKSVVIEEKKFKHSPWAGARQPIRAKILMWTGKPHHYVVSLKRISSISDFIHIFSWFNKMYIAAGQGQTTPGDKILMSTEISCHLGHLLQVPNKSLWSLILYNCFHDFMYVYSPGQGLTTPWGQIFMSTGTSCHFGHLLQVSKRWSQIL